MEHYGPENAVGAGMPRPGDPSRHAQTSRLAPPREPTAPLLGETIGRLGSLIGRLTEVAHRTHSAKDVMFGATPSPAGTGGNTASPTASPKDMPTSEVIRNQLGALEHLAMLLEEDTQALINQLL